jgi:peptidoglycan/xylan/chitin deacetylase (PgdA/CDA1 family)
LLDSAGKTIAAGSMPVRTASATSRDFGGRWGPFSTSTGGGGSMLRAVPKMPLGAMLRRCVTKASSKVGAAIMYHGVSSDSPVESEKLVPTVPVQLLDRHVWHLRRCYRPVVASRLQDAVALRRPSEAPPISVTFDDDHWSYVPLALPVLQRHGVRATFLLNGAWAGEPRWFPWEYLQAAWDAGEMDDLLPRMPPSVADAAQDRDMPLRSISLALTALPRSERTEMEHMIEKSVDIRAMPARMTAEDVRELAAAGQEIGFHTRRHEHLTELSDAELRAAMSDGRTELEDLASAPVTVLAYPFGCWDERVAQAAERAGFRAAFTVDPVAIHDGSPPFELGRIPGPLAGSATLSFVTARLLAASHGGTRSIRRGHGS